MSSSSPLLAVALVLSLAGCGFQPLYGSRGADGATVNQQMANIAIPVIPDRIGQLVRNTLLDQMTPYGQPGAPAYVLRVGLVENRDTQLLRFDATSSRQRYTLWADFRLMSGDQVVQQGKARSVVSYDLPDTSSYYYTSVASQRDAEIQAADDVAQQIKTRIAMYLAQQGSTPK